MSAAALSIDGLESQQGASNELLSQDSSPLRDVSNPNRNDTSDVTMLEEKDIMPGQGGQDADFQSQKPRLTIRELREAAQKEALASQAVKAAQNSLETQRKSNATRQKKKPSIFGGLFQVREPTQIALNQVAAQMIAQHGSISATKVPNVRLEKMPDFVPKVNSKWDGIPESVRQREKREKEKEKDRARRASFFFTESKARSDGRGKRRTNVGSRNSSSTTGSSFGAHGNSSGSQGASSRTRFYAQSVNSSGDLISQRRTDASAFPRSLALPSALSLTESLSENPSSPRCGSSSADTRSQHPVGKDLAPEHRNPLVTAHLPPSRVESTIITAGEYETPYFPVADRPRVGGGQSLKSPTDAAIEVDPHHVNVRTDSLPAANPSPLHQTSPFETASLPTSPCLGMISPSRQGVTEITSLQSALVSSGPGVPRPPAAVKKFSGTKFNNAFLAGEAQELVLPDDVCDRGSADPTVQTWELGRSRIQQDLEKRPDSSRDRLGLRASMLLSDDVTPWEFQETNQPPPSSPKLTNHVPNTKTKFHKPFGRIGKEKEKEKWKARI